MKVIDAISRKISNLSECQKPHKILESLKRSLLKAWDDIDADMKRASSKNAHKRFEAVVKADGGYIEKKINFL